MHKGSDCDQTRERIQGGLRVGHDLGAESEERKGEDRAQCGGGPEAAGTRSERFIRSSD